MLLRVIKPIVHLSDVKVILYTYIYDFSMKCNTVMAYIVLIEM